MNSSETELNKTPDKRPNIFLRLLGPGLVTGAATMIRPASRLIPWPGRNLVMACCGQFF
jgi:hypothetical protein